MTDLMVVRSTPPNTQGDDPVDALRQRLALDVSAQVDIQISAHAVAAQVVSFLHLSTIRLVWRQGSGIVGDAQPCSISDGHLLGVMIGTSCYLVSDCQRIGAPFMCTVGREPKLVD